MRQLSTDPRKEVRKQLASQLTEQTKRVGDLTKGVNDLRSQIESEIGILGKLVPKPDDAG